MTSIRRMLAAFFVVFSRHERRTASARDVRGTTRVSAGARVRRSRDVCFWGSSWHLEVRRVDDVVAARGK